MLSEEGQDTLSEGDPRDMSLILYLYAARASGAKTLALSYLKSTSVVPTAWSESLRVSIRITLGWGIDRSLTATAQYLGNTFTFGAVDRTQVRTTFRTFIFRTACACVPRS